MNTPPARLHKKQEQKNMEILILIKQYLPRIGFIMGIILFSILLYQLCGSCTESNTYYYHLK